MKSSLVFLALFALDAEAQTRNLAIDVHPVGGAVSMAWRTAPNTYAGIGLGIGTNNLSETLRPRDRQTFHDFEQLAFVDVLLRRKLKRHIDLDGGLRTGIGEVRACSASDCLPGGYAGVFVAGFVGSARWKIGTRLLAARVWEARYRDDVLHWDVISLRYSR